MNETVLDCDNKCVERKQEEGKQPILPRAGPPALIRLWRVYALFKLHLLLCEITKMDKGVPASAFCMCCCIAAAHWSLCPRLEALWGHVRSKTSAPVSSVYAAQPELTGDESNYSRPAFSLFISFINPKILHKSSIGWGGATQKDAVLSPANERRIVRSLHLSPGFHAPSLTLSYFSLSLSLSLSVLQQSKQPPGWREHSAETSAAFSGGKGKEQLGKPTNLQRHMPRVTPKTPFPEGVSLKWWWLSPMSHFKPSHLCVLSSASKPSKPPHIMYLQPTRKST